MGKAKPKASVQKAKGGLDVNDMLLSSSKDHYFPLRSYLTRFKYRIGVSSVKQSGRNPAYDYVNSVKKMIDLYKAGELNATEYAFPTLAFQVLRTKGKR